MPTGRSKPGDGQAAAPGPYTPSRPCRRDPGALRARQSGRTLVVALRVDPDLAAGKVATSHEGRRQVFNPFR